MAYARIFNYANIIYFRIGCLAKQFAKQLLTQCLCLVTYLVVSTAVKSVLKVWNLDINISTVWKASVCRQARQVSIFNISPLTVKTNLKNKTQEKVIGWNPAMFHKQNIYNYPRQVKISQRHSLLTRYCLNAVSRVMWDSCGTQEESQHAVNVSGSPQNHACGQPDLLSSPRGLQWHPFKFSHLHVNNHLLFEP